MTIQAKYDATSGLNVTKVSGFATASLDLTADIRLISNVEGDTRNGQTFQLITAAAADNDAAGADALVKVAFTGTKAAVVCTVTPDNLGDGNAANDVTLTEAELVELINTGAVAGKKTEITDALGLRTLQRAADGGANILANGGNGSDVTATFAGAPTGKFHLEGVGVSSTPQVNAHEVFKLTCPGDSATLFKSTIDISTPSQTFRIFFNRTNSGVSAPSGAENLDLSENGADDAAAVATALDTLLEGLGANNNAFDSARVEAVLTVSCHAVGAPRSPLDMGTSGVVAEVTQAGSGSRTLTKTGVTLLSSTVDKAATSAEGAMTLEDLTAAEAGTLKTIIQTDAGTADKQVKVPGHIAGANTVFTFDAENESLMLIWLGSKWANAALTGASQA